IKALRGLCHLDEAALIPGLLPVAVIKALRGLCHSDRATRFEQMIDVAVIKALRGLCHSDRATRFEQMIDVAVIKALRGLCHGSPHNSRFYHAFRRVLRAVVRLVALGPGLAPQPVDVTCE